jgi:hypothetical protein
MTPKGANLQATDLLEISELSGTGYITKSITGQEIINAGGGGGSQDLQQVTDIGATTTNAIQITHSGSTDTLTATHSSGSGIGLLITKGGNNEGLKVNKTSGSGNAATIIGTLEATTLVKTGGTSSQYLMADGSTNTLDQASILSLLGFFISKTTTPSSNVTGTTQTIVNSIAIGGNRLASSDKLIIDSDFVKTTTVGQYALRYYLAPNSNNLTGAVQIAVASAIGMTTAYIPSFFRSFTIDGGDLKGFPFSQSVVVPSATVNAMSTTPFNVADTFYLITTITLNNGLDSAYLNSQTIKNF